MSHLDKDLLNSRTEKKSDSSTIQDLKIDFDEDDPLKDLLSSSKESTPTKISSRNTLDTYPLSHSRQHSKSKLIVDLFGLQEVEELQAPNYNTKQPSPSSKRVNKSENPAHWLGLKAEPYKGLEYENLDTKTNKFVLSTPESHHSHTKIDIKNGDLPAPESRETSKTENPSKAPTLAVKTDDGSTFKPSSHMVRVQENQKTSSILNSFMSDFDSKPVSPADISRINSKDFRRDADSGKGSYILSASRGPRRGNRQRAGEIVDPLGLFSQPENTTRTDPIIPKAGTNEEVEKHVSMTTGKPLQPATLDLTPPWLGGTNVTPTSLDPIINGKKTTPDDSKSVDLTDTNPPTQNESSILSGITNLETQAGEAATQQQKSFITALALKKQENILLKLQANQAQHEQQLGALVQRQVQRQQQMLRQQEQIQAHILALMVQPPDLAPIKLPTSIWSADDSGRSNAIDDLVIEPAMNRYGKNSDASAELKDKIQRLEKENEDLKIQIEGVKQRHNNQLVDLENLFRKQLAIQEESLSRHEKSLLLDKEAIEKEAMIKMNRLKEEHSEATGQQAQRMAQLHSEWLADLQRLSEFHKQAVDMLRSEQTSAIDHWKNLQLAEISAIQDASSNARLLNEAVKHVQESTTILTQLRDEIKKEFQAHYLVKHDMLQRQETQVAGLKDALEKQASALDTERSCLSTMTREMESHLLRQQQEFDKERSQLEAREKAWEKEKFGAVELLKQEKEHLERLQSKAKAELTELSERKLALATEVARLEATLQIQFAHANRNSQHAEQMVAEARSTLEAAQEAGKEVQKERAEMITLKLQIQAEQNRLSNLQREIQAREKKTEEEIERGKALKEEGLSALDEARRLERERTEHASDLAQRLLYLKEREDRFSQEKLAITMEWKKLQESRENKSKCSYCGHLESVTLSRLGSSENIVDPMPIIMKLEAEQGLDFITIDHPKYHSSVMESVSQ